MVDSVRAIFELQATRAKITRRGSPTERSMPASTERDQEKRGRRRKEEEEAQHTERSMLVSTERDREKRGEKKEKRPGRRRRRRRRSGLDVIDIKIKMKKEINKKYWKKNSYIYISKFSKLAMVFLKIDISGKVSV
jgi:hypothetical protein